tara:strand:- start:6458 stop:8086 length:1629 start_codon:yes stop_codon:yes gene_type:complete
MKLYKDLFIKVIIKMESKMKQCRKCLKELSIDRFSKHSGTKDKLDNRCKDCVKLAKKKTVESETKSKLSVDTTVTDETSKDWQGGKYSGTIFKRKNSNVWTVKVGGKTKSFNPVDFNDSDKLAKEKAEKWMKIKSDKFGLTKNKYKIIFDKSNKPEYLIVQLKKQTTNDSNTYCFLTDYKFLEKIKNNMIYASKSSKSDENYVRMYGEETNKKVVTYHNFITGNQMTDHYNRFPFDNRLVNLRDTNYSENNKNKTCIKKICIAKLITNNKFEAQITYIKTYKFEEETLTKVFDQKPHATLWIKEMSKNLDSNNYNDIQERLSKSFIDIMVKNANEFIFMTSKKEFMNNISKDEDNSYKKDLDEAKKEIKELKQQLKEKTIDNQKYPSKWHLGKSNGSLKKNVNSYLARYTDKVSKTFKFSDFKSTEDTKKEAEKWLYDTSLKDNKVVNLIRYIDEDTIEVQLTKDKIMKTDAKFIPIIQDYKLSVKEKKYNGTSKFYAAWRKTNKETNKKESGSFVKLISDIRVCKFINNDTLDCRLANITD